MSILLKYFIENCDGSMSSNMEDRCEGRVMQEYPVSILELFLQWRCNITNICVHETYMWKHFVLYIDALAELATWYFSMDQINFARWPPVYVHAWPVFVTVILGFYRSSVTTGSLSRREQIPFPQWQKARHMSRIMLIPRVSLMPSD